MKRLLAILVLGLLSCNTSLAVENWEIERVLDNEFTQVSTNGNITHGDKYRLLIRNNGECDVVEDTFTFYTMANHPDILKIEDKKIGLEAMGTKMLANITSSSPFLAGHIVWISNGLYKIDEHIKFLEKKEKLEVSLIYVFSDLEKKLGWNAEDMFDIKYNSWNLKNVSEALKQGQKMCKSN